MATTTCRSLLLAGLLAASALGFAQPQSQSDSQPEAATGSEAKPVALGRRFMAVTANPHASEAAAAMLGRGGSALDAALAAQFVLNVVEPQSSGIGGGAFLLVWDAKARRLRAYDGRETAPAAARSDRFLGPGGKPLAFHDAAVGARSVGVPGLVAVAALAHARHGRLPWPELFAPAIRLAREGYAVSPRLHGLLATDRYLRGDPRARALYYDAQGRPWPAGHRLSNPELAASLRRVADQGPEAFYRGAIGEHIVETLASHRPPGDLGPGDLAAYRAVERDPVCGGYRGYRICGMPPPSSGGVTTLQLLALLERFPVGDDAPLSARSMHRFSEAGRLAYADRARYLADPAFVPVPVAGLLDRSYLRARAALIDEAHSMGRASAGEIPGEPARERAAAIEAPSTTHLSIVDGEGNAVALTSSIEDAFGSRILVDGFLLNNQLTDFAFVPDTAGGPVANRVEAGKRPLSSMAPTMVFDPHGALFAVLGSPGGSRIINYVAQTLAALIDWRLPAGEAVALPHGGSRNGPTELERGTPAAALESQLQALGHDVRIADMTSGVHLIVRTPKGWAGAADPRREGAARGE